MSMVSRSRKVCRRGMASLDAALCLGGAFPIAAALYFFAEFLLDMFFFLVGNAVGSPYL